MSDVSTSSNPSTPPSSSWDQVDLGALEARLNSLGVEPETESSTEVEIPSLLDQFMQDPSLNFLGSRSTDLNHENPSTETVVEYHRISFAPDQTRAILHLSFQPDLSKAPSVEVNLIDTEGRTRITQNAKFGVRIEISLLNRSSNPSTVCVETVSTTASEN